MCCRRYEFFFFIILFIFFLFSDLKSSFWPVFDEQLVVAVIACPSNMNSAAKRKQWHGLIIKNISLDVSTNENVQLQCKLTNHAQMIKRD